jgi:Fe-S cluster assembly scaffold protein SufB
VRLRIREIRAKDIAEDEILALRLEAYRVTDRKKTNRYRGSQVNQIGLDFSSFVYDHYVTIVFVFFRWFVLG